MSGAVTAGTPVRILVSERTRDAIGDAIAAALNGATPVFVAPGEDADLAFVSREVTGLSTKHQVMPETQRFYDGMANAPSLRWVQMHSAGADRPIYLALRRRGVVVTSSSGTNAAIVAQTALAGILALGRGFPQLIEAQREHRWSSLVKTGMPRDLEGQTATIVGWGPIGQRLAALLSLLGLSVGAVRSSGANAAPAAFTVPFERLGEVLPRTDWLVLACPLTDRTRGLVDRAALALLPAGARIVNVARGEVVDEAALIDALRGGRLAGAFLDVFAQEPLPPESALWSLPNVLVWPHSAGHSDGNERRVAEFFLGNLARWAQGLPLVNAVA
ncbi:MAG TPA: D-2-hydroxyacid dehydrogenase [Burkholderiaceae bacterium]|jgi:phosphoglycerate dehydrogenase-like enzyme